MSIDLLTLVPEKFRDSEILQQYLEVVSELLEEWHTKIAGLAQLKDPYSVDGQYLQYLADLIGVTLSDPDTTSESQRRKELLRAIDWYKMKGTYQSLQVIALWSGLTFTIYDKYTNDYSNFVDVEWFVGNEGENPSGLDSSYYKSPHFGMVAALDRVYDAGTYTEGYLDRHLWRPSLLGTVEAWVEKTRPVNTVPHFGVLHTCITDETLDPYLIISTETITRIVGNWSYSKIFFDGDYDGSGNQVYFDNGDYFDSNIEAFISSITTWKLGTSSTSGGLDLIGDPPGGGFSLSNVVLQGTIDSYTIGDDKIDFEFTVPKSSVQYDIAELGLYTAGGELMIAATFRSLWRFYTVWDDLHVQKYVSGSWTDAGVWVYDASDYIGNEWRFQVEGTQVLVQKRVEGVWVTHSSFEDSPSSRTQGFEGDFVHNMGSEWRFTDPSGRLELQHFRGNIWYVIASWDVP